MNKGRTLLLFNAVSMTSSSRLERRHATSGWLRPQTAAPLRGAPSPSWREGLHSTNIMFSLMRRGPNSAAFVCVPTGLTGCSSAAEAGGASGSCGAAVRTSQAEGRSQLCRQVDNPPHPPTPDSPFLFSL